MRCACLQQHHSLKDDDVRLLQAVYNRVRRARRADSSGSSRDRRGACDSWPHRALRVVLWPHDRPGPRALTKASTGRQLLVVGGSSAVGGWTTNVDHGDDRWVALLGPLGRIVIPKLTYVTDICNGRCMLHIISDPTLFRVFLCYITILERSGRDRKRKRSSHLYSSKNTPRNRRVTDA